jgi:hypothetical protein
MPSNEPGHRARSTLRVRGDAVVDRQLCCLVRERAGRVIAAKRQVWMRLRYYRRRTSR